MRFSYQVFNGNGALVTTKATFRGAKEVAEKYQGHISVGNLTYRKVNGLWSAANQTAGGK